MQNKLQNDKENLSTWESLIKRFNSLITGSPSVEKVKDELIALKEEASLKNGLNYRQTDAMVSRIDHYINGRYGNTKDYQPNDYDHARSKTSKPPQK